MAELTDHERQVLRMLAGEIELPWGAWISACLEHLRAVGYATGIPYRITEAGRAALEAKRDG